MKIMVNMVLTLAICTMAAGMAYSQDPAAPQPVAAEQTQAVSQPAAQPAAEPVAAPKAEEVKFTGGTVVSVNKDAGSITVNEYDIDTDTEVNVTYAVNAQTEVKGVAAWTDIPVNSYVDIEYLADASGQKAAKYLGVYSEEETMVE
jgi:CxxC motif-containing protein (DUF1111 family)